MFAHSYPFPSFLRLLLSSSSSFIVSKNLGVDGPRLLAAARTNAAIFTLEGETQARVEVARKPRRRVAELVVSKKGRVRHEEALDRPVHALDLMVGAGVGKGKTPKIARFSSSYIKTFWDRPFVQRSKRV